jgi:CBS domain-containing protein
VRNVRDILREKGRTVHSISPEATVFDALKTMADKNVGALAVFKGDELVGIISERDYARKIVLRSKFSKDTPVNEIMSTDVATVIPDSDIEKCMELMTEKRVRHLPVVEGEHVVGIISIGDIVKGIIDHKEAIIEQLEAYIKGRR